MSVSHRRHRGLRSWRETSSLRASIASCSRTGTAPSAPAAPRTIGSSWRRSAAQITEEDVVATKSVYRSQRSRDPGRRARAVRDRGRQASSRPRTCAPSSRSAAEADGMPPPLRRRPCGASPAIGWPHEHQRWAGQWRQSGPRPSEGGAHVRVEMKPVGRDPNCSSATDRGSRCV